MVALHGFCLWLNRRKYFERVDKTFDKNINKQINQASFYPKFLFNCFELGFVLERKIRFAL